MEHFAMTVANEVRAQLARRRISGQQAADRLGWTQGYIQRRLAGKVAFDVADLGALAALLEVPVTAFFVAPSGATSGVISLPSSARHLWAMAA
jgi:transcriptional regulator with XRE-family HTH domain